MVLNAAAFLFPNGGTILDVHCCYKQCKHIARCCLSWWCSWLWHLPCDVWCCSHKNRKCEKSGVSEWVLAVLKVIRRYCHWAVRTRKVFVVTISISPCLCSNSTFLCLGQALVSSEIDIGTPWLVVLMMFFIWQNKQMLWVLRALVWAQTAKLHGGYVRVFVRALLWCEQDKYQLCSKGLAVSWPRQHFVFAFAVLVHKHFGLLQTEGMGKQILEEII